MPRQPRLMPDDVRTVPTGQDEKLCSDRWAAFSRIEVKPKRSESDYRVPARPVMPLLARGQCLDDEFGETQTIAWAAVRCHSEPYGETYYWYEYVAVNGVRTLD